jgi:hypothetical protein
MEENMKEEMKKPNGRLILWSTFANFDFGKGGETGSANLLIGAHRLIIRDSSDQWETNSKKTLDFHPPIEKVNNCN